MTAANKFTLKPDAETTEPLPPRQQSLREQVEATMQRYFAQLDGQPTTDLYQLVLQEVELPLLESVLAYTHGNQSKASEILGLNRGTLRKKLKQYNLL